MFKPKIIIVFSLVVLAVAFFVVRHNRTNLFYQCEKSGKISKVSCWEDLTRTIVKKEGISRAFDFIAYAYDQDSEFAQPCHAMVHIIGQAAYIQFRSTGSVELSQKTASCAFGFYHGFMETLVARKGTIEEARDFCEYVDETLKEITPNAKYSCYHGIGHGSTDVHSPTYYGNEQAIVSQALVNCEAFAQDDHQLKLCATGIFDSISIAYYNNGQNGLVMKKDDPLWLCHAQPQKYKEACYRDMMPAVIWMGEHDLVKAAPIVFTHAEETYKEFALKILAENSIRFIMNKTPATIYVPFCRGTAYHMSCIEGLASGVMQFGPPDREYEGALSFCRESILTLEEKKMCMEETLGYTKARYGKKKVADICAVVEEEYKTYCN